jgi:hypothetical protein
LHHDLVVLDQNALIGGREIGKPVVFAAIWGAMENPDQIGRPLAQAALRSQTSLQKTSTLEATKYAAGRILEPDWKNMQGAAKNAFAAVVSGISDKKLDHFLAKTIANSATCLSRIGVLQNFALAANIEGTQIGRAQVRSDARVRSFLPDPLWRPSGR